jgi:hypothetical protein
MYYETNIYRALVLCHQACVLTGFFFVLFGYIDTNSAVSGKYNVYVYDTYKLGIGEAYRASSQFCTTSAQTLFFKTLYQFRHVYWLDSFLFYSGTDRNIDLIVPLLHVLSGEHWETCKSNLVFDLKISPPMDFFFCRINTILIQCLKK